MSKAQEIRWPAFFKHISESGAFPRGWTANDIAEHTPQQLLGIVTGRLGATALPVLTRGPGETNAAFVARAEAAHAEWQRTQAGAVVARAELERELRRLL